MPDPVLDVPQEEREARIWQNDVMMEVQDTGAFVRALLPVHLTEGHTLTFGLWLGVSPQDLRRAYHDWWSPSYPSLVLDGLIANDVQPWGLLGRPVRAVVRNPDETPYADSSADAETQTVLSDEWPHEMVLNALPEYLR